MKKVISGILSASMLVSSAFAAVPSDFSDIPDNWAKEPIEHAIKNGLLNGANGKINPMGNLTRAEMCAIIGRTVKAQNAGTIQFSDVSTGDWFYQDVAKAFAMGVVGGSGNTMRPNDPISRQETMVVLSRLFQLSASQAESTLNAFSDAADISSWAKESVAAMIEAGYVGGANGKINPKSFITRAEFAAMMDRMVNTYISEAEVVTNAAGENIMINTVNGGTTLKDTAVEGNLIIGDGVSEGDITLDNVQVSGKILVRGGGVNSIHFVGGSSAKSVVLAKPKGGVRVTSDAACKITNIDVKNSEAKIEGKVENITISKENSNISLKNAKVDNVVTNASNSVLNVGEGSELEVGVLAKEANGSKIIVDRRATVGQINVSASNVVVSGDGKVAQADVQANDVQINTNSTKVTVGDGFHKVTAGNQNLADGKTSITSPNTSTQTPGGSVVRPPQGGSSGGSIGGGGGGSVATVDKLQAFTVYGKNGASIATGEISGNTCVIDLSNCSLTDTIVSGMADTKYGGDLQIGKDYTISTDKIVTVVDLYKAMGISSQTESISVGALKNLIADGEALKALFEKKTNKEWPAEVILGNNNFTVKATLSYRDYKTNITFDVRLPQ